MNKDNEDNPNFLMLLWFYYQVMAIIFFTIFNILRCSGHTCFITNIDEVKQDISVVFDKAMETKRNGFLIKVN